MSLFNAIGQQLKFWNTNFNKNEINLPINVASGIYLVHIKTNNGNNIKKIIIN
ncbi:T9SS type A sorting domain-containing protein [Gramella jeungdoensis]|uniref:T9SS type A sorting domain-containing protein n=1 Tax=Gramella jeungdoensis TaxID=708091 RepID=UPI003D7170B5